MNLIDGFIAKLARPSDRTFSARSEDGISWIREGVRIEKSQTHPAENAFYCFIHQPADLDGHYEMFYHAASQDKNGWNTQILRAVSSDGLNWNQRPEVILDSAAADQTLRQIRAPHLLRFGGRWRLFFSAKSDGDITQIYSAVSDDRRVWDLENGVRISPDLFTKSGLTDAPEGVSDSSIMPLDDGSLRMFFSAHRDGLWKQNICSAVSKDGLNWKVEAGIRIDYGGDGFRFVANNPALVQIDGRWRLYFRGSNNMPIRDKIFLAESVDGLEWKVLGVVLAPDPGCYKEKQEVAHPFVFKTRENMYRMYYTGCCGMMIDTFSYRYYEKVYRSKGIPIIYD